ncbi:MAG: cytochrome c biogenesis protein ResB [Proteobacteria bacterium]|nr:cytochrome c biogenesis protein ResB [Pseudomonadota bacterium]
MSDSTGQGGSSRKNKGLFSAVHDFLASVGLAIFLLIVLAVTSIFGTLILQNARPDQYLVKYGPGLTRVLKFLALDDMYRSWWFLSLLILLLINITLCNFKRFPRTWKIMTRSPRVLDEKLFATSKFKGSIRRKIDPDGAAAAAREVLVKHYGKPAETREGNSVTLFVEKGRFGRMGAYVVHISILLLAVGALYGGLVGFKGFIALAEGQTTNRVPLRDKAAAIKLDFSVRCDDFQLEYYPGTRQPKDYFSDLVVIRDGQEVLKKRIEVNHPLIVDGIYFYQSSYGVDRSSTVTLEVLDPAEKIAGPSVTVHPGQEFRVMGDPSVYTLSEIIPNALEGQPGVRMAQRQGGSRMEFFLLSAFPGRDKMRGGPLYFRIADINLVEYTGLQVAWDPGVPIIWLACGVMILGLYMAFFVVHQRVWIRVGLDPEETAVLMAGTTNRNPASFEKEFETALSHLKEGLKR